MDTELFTSLRKYSPREGMDPLENFVTEAFAWILKNNSKVAKIVIDNVLKLPTKAPHFEINAAEAETAVWSTQEPWGVRPDMVCKANHHAIVFEHKVWSSLHNDQLPSYRRCATTEFGLGNFVIVLISATPSQHQQDFDVAFCWRDVYAWLSAWQKTSEGNDHIVDCFLSLLKNEGLGPVAPVSHAEILGFYTSRHVREHTENLVGQIRRDGNLGRIECILDEFKVAHHLATENVYCGLYGLNLSADGWGPGLLVGFLLDWDTWQVKPLLGDVSPDFSLILSFDRDLHRQYPTNDDYRALVEQLKSSPALKRDGWDVHDHLAVDNPRNLYHPLHIRKPMSEVLRDTQTTEEQQEQFLRHGETVLRALLNIGAFHRLKALGENSVRGRACATVERYKDNCQPFSRLWRYNDGTVVFEGFPYRGSQFAIDVGHDEGKYSIKLFNRGATLPAQVEQLANETGVMFDSTGGGAACKAFRIEEKEQTLKFLDGLLQRLREIGSLNTNAGST